MSTKIYADHDPTFKTLLLQQALATGGFYTGAIDNWWGPRSQDAYEAFLDHQNGTPAPRLENEENRYRDINQAGRDLIQHFEGLYLTAYQDEVGIWTIGWGHTGLVHNDGTVHKGRTITREEAEQLFSHDMDVFEGRVGRLIDVPLNDNEFSALVSFDFNTGGLEDSTLRKLLNTGDRAGAANQFARWNKGTVNGRIVVLPGLTRRRASEKNLFLGKLPCIVA